jgi:hypothetical protein
MCTARTVACVSSGEAPTRTAFRTVWESTAQRRERRASLVGRGHGRIGRDHQWHPPFVIGAAGIKADSALLKAVARADQWLSEILSGRSGSLDEIGKRTGVGKRYVSRIIRLAFLAPSIIEEIADGQQPPELTTQALSTRRGDLPLSWRSQRELLGLDTI